MKWKWREPSKWNGIPCTILGYLLDCKKWGKIFERTEAEGETGEVEKGGEKSVSLEIEKESHSSLGKFQLAEQKRQQKKKLFIPWQKPG